MIGFLSHPRRKPTEVVHHPKGCGKYRPLNHRHARVFSMTDTLLKAVNQLRRKVIPARAIDEIDRAKDGKILYPSATGPWVRLPQGSILFIEEHGEDLVAVLTGQTTDIEDADRAILIDALETP